MIDDLLPGKVAADPKPDPVARENRGAPRASPDVGFFIRPCNVDGLLWLQYGKGVVMRLTLVAIVVALASPAHAQNGWGDLGRLLSGADRQDTRAYDEAYRRAVETDLSYWSAVRARQEADQAQQQAQAIFLLTDAWHMGGLDLDEARAVASAFEFTNEYPAIARRIQREGVEPGIRAAWAAYEDHRYLLANQLLLAALVANREAQKAERSPNALFLLPDD